MSNRDTEINIKLTSKAMEIYRELPRPKNHFVSEAIIEKWAKEHGEVFTKEQLKRMRQEIEKIVKEMKGK